MKKIFISQDRLKELETYAEYKKNEVYKKEILEDTLLKEYIAFKKENKDDAYFIELFKNNIKSISAFSAKIFAECGIVDMKKIKEERAYFCIWTNGNCFGINDYSSDKKAFKSFWLESYFYSSKIEEQKIVIDKTIDTFIKKLKKMLYEYYNIEK